jgi:hypothetical protein
MSQAATAPEPGIILYGMGETESTGPIAVVAPISVGGKETLVIGRQDWSEDLGIVHFSPSSSVDMLQQTLEENLSLRQTVQTLQSQMAVISSALGLDQTEPRDITKALAKREIRTYFREHDGEEIYPDDIADVLNLDLMQVITVCDELEKDGRIVSKA